MYDQVFGLFTTVYEYDTEWYIKYKQTSISHRYDNNFSKGFVKVLYEWMNEKRGHNSLWMRLKSFLPFTFPSSSNPLLCIS